MVGIDGTQRYGVGVGALGLRLSEGRTHLRDGAGYGGFLLCVSHNMDKRWRKGGIL